MNFEPTTLERQFFSNVGKGLSIYVRARKAKDYNPDQPRDEEGQWTEGSSGVAVGKRYSPPTTVGGPYTWRSSRWVDKPRYKEGDRVKIAYGGTGRIVKHVGSLHYLVAHEDGTTSDVWEKHLKRMK